MYIFALEKYSWITIMAEALNVNNTTTVSPVDALWSLIQYQNKTIRRILAKRLDESLKADKAQTSIDSTTARNIAKARREYSKGETISCSTPEEMQRYFDSL